MPKVQKVGRPSCLLGRTGENVCFRGQAQFGAVEGLSPVAQS